MPSFDINHSLKIKNFDKHQKNLDSAIKKYAKSSNKDLQLLLDKSVQAGKKMRSNLVLAAAGDNIDEKVYSAGAAIELIHLSSLVHDDSLDQAATRRGLPTIYAESGHEKALLVGDVLFACAHKAAADAGQQVAQVIAEGCRFMCEGQYLEELDGYNVKRTKTSYEAAVVAKTSSLIIAAIKAGACFNENLDSKVIDKFGKHFGLAFQQVDDLLDLLSTRDLLGKPVHQDMKQGVYTMPVLHSLSTSTNAKTIMPYLEVAKNLQFDKEKLIADIDCTGGFKAALKEIKLNVKTAQDSVKEVSELAGISKLTLEYVDWALKNQVAKQHLDKVK